MTTTLRNDLWSPVARQSPSAPGPFAGRPRTQTGPAAVHGATPGIAEDADATLDGVFRERVRRTPGAVAYVHYDRSRGRWEEISWGTMAIRVACWQTALMGLGLHPGERVALMLPNGPDWVAFDQAALGLGLVTVPLYPGDRPDNVDWVLRDAGCRLLLIEGREQWRALAPIAETLGRLAAVISLRAIPADLPNLHQAAHWLPSLGAEAPPPTHAAGDLATLVYTSGTTGRPKGVMLSHCNILANVWAGLAAVRVDPEDSLFSFLPLSHMLERTVGYYLPMVAGCRVTYARSIQDLPQDLRQIRPSILISVPRVFERVRGRILEALADASPTRRRLFELALELGGRRHRHRQGRGPWSPGLLIQPLLDRWVGARVRTRLGGRLRFAISGGAPLPEGVARLFLSLGVEILQGYGLTETSPVIAVNRLGDNEPTSVGPPLPGVQVRTGADDELLVRGPSVMLGYWQDPQATGTVIDAEGWLHTGDQARIGPRGHIAISGRLEDILVLSTGEKVPPADLEQALAGSPLVEQALIVGDGRPYLAALLVLAPGALEALARGLGLDMESGDLRHHPAIEQALLDRLQPELRTFPGYAKLVRVAIADGPWSTENGLMTPTLKLRRAAILHRYRANLEHLYDGH